MKHIKFLTAILATTMFLTLNVIQAQTKQETLDWIKQKVSKYGNYDQGSRQYSDKYIYKISGDRIYLEIWFQRWDGGEKALVGKYSVNLNHIIGTTSGIDISTQGLKISRLKKGLYSDEVENDDYVSQFDFFKGMQFDSEPDLKTRFKKALLTLADFNKAETPKETF